LYANLHQAGAVLFVQDKPIENGQDLFPVFVNALQVLQEIGFEIPGAHPLVEHAAWHVDILAEILYIVAAKKEAVKERCLPLGR
jgi:hypothetical protein